MWSISVPSLPGGKTTGISLRLSNHGGGETRLAARDAGNGIYLTCTDTPRGKYSRTYEYERHSIITTRTLTRTSIVTRQGTRRALHLRNNSTQPRRSYALTPHYNPSREEWFYHIIVTRVCTIQNKAYLHAVLVRTFMC